MGIEQLLQLSITPKICSTKVSFSASKMAAGKELFLEICFE